MMFEVPVPDEKTREKIFNIHTKNKPLAKNINLKNFAKETENMVGSDIEYICKKAAMLGIREYIENRHNRNDKKKEDLKIKEKHFEEVITLVKKQNSIKNK